MLYMILLILLSWLIFRLPSVADLGDYLARMFPFFRAAPDYVFAQDYLPYLTGVGPLMLAGLLFCTPLPRRVFEKIKPIPWVAIPILLVIFWWAVYLIANGANNPFMYVNF